MHSYIYNCDAKCTAVFAFYNTRSGILRTAQLFLLLLVYIRQTNTYSSKSVSKTLPLNDSQTIFNLKCDAVILFTILSRRSENVHLFLCKEYLHYPTLRYHHPVNASLVGLAFQANTLEILKKMFCHESNLYSVKSFNSLNTEHIPFVTAANDVYFQNVLVTIRSVQMHFPYARIVLYDLGLERNQSEYASKLCNVKVMKFPFDEFPEFVSTLSEFRWKPIILMLSLMEYGTLWYLDSSIMLTSSNLLPVTKLTQTENALFCFIVVVVMVSSARQIQKKFILFFFGGKILSYVVKLAPLKGPAWLHRIRTRFVNLEEIGIAIMHFVTDTTSLRLTYFLQIFCITKVTAGLVPAWSNCWNITFQAHELGFYEISSF
ncbi:conserved hypothetical protein [Trichinella spiralis]|uniref:hypothetical protein n=1 Tax=Trichinella spiralis TaxID=6334 RepID=UPI0001EFDF56|nr:conserved hypothetical protein [Trichinella spiralis]